MTQTIIPNFDTRYSVLFVERSNMGQLVSLVEEPVTAWLHQLEPGASTPSQQPLHPSAALKGDRYLKRPAGNLLNLETGKAVGKATLLMGFREKGLRLKDVKVLDPAEWGGAFEFLDAD